MQQHYIQVLRNQYSNRIGLIEIPLMAQEVKGVERINKISESSLSRSNGMVDYWNVGMSKKVRRNGDSETLNKKGFFSLSPYLPITLSAY